MSRISEAEGKLGNTESVCPYCNIRFDKFPLRKTKCKNCGNDIYSRTRPFDLQKVLLTKTDADKIEYQWAVENNSEGFETLKGYYEEKDRERRVFQTLTAKLNREPTAQELRKEVLIVGLFEERQETLNSYLEMEVEKAQILAGQNACVNCRKKNGVIYKVSDMPNPPVLNCLEEYCRCTYAAVIDE